MSDATFGLVLNLLLFAGLGAGPCLCLLSGPRRLALAAAMAPAMGFVLTAIFGTYLTLMDLPVSRWCLPWIIVALTCSAALTVACLLRQRIGARRAGKRWLVLAACGFIVTAALTVAPWSLGGLQYTILRGNGTDSFNYITAAGYLDHEPYSWASHVSTQTLVDRHPSYERARELLIGRWATFMMLAFTSRVAGAPAYRFEYLFSVLFFLLAYGPVLIYARIFLKLRPWHAVLTALAVCAGFWAQLILDLRADAQQNSVPVLLLIAVLIAHMEDRRAPRVYWKEHVLLGVAVLSLLFFYPEILPMAALGCAVFLGVYLWRNPAPGRRLLGYCVSFGIVAVGAIPMVGLLARFVQFQFSYAAGGVNNWHIAYFKWLYTDPLTGIWGFGPIVGRPALHIVLLLVAAVLTTALVAAGIRALWSPSRANAGMALAASLTLAAGLEWLYLGLRKQYWAGAKGLSFGYVFLILTMLGFVLGSRHVVHRGWRQTAGYAATACALIWLLVQCGLALYRPWLVAFGGDYTNYIYSHGEYRRHHWNLKPFDAVLHGQNAVTVWLDLPNPWVSEYIGFALGWDVHLVNIGASREVEELRVPRQSTAQPPQYLIIQNNQTSGAAPSVMARTRELLLLKFPETRAILLSVSNPNTIEGTEQAPFFWMGGPPTTFEFASFDNPTVTIKARYLMGPSRPNLTYRHLVITAGGSKQHLLIRDGRQAFQVPAVRGLNRFVAEVEEKPTFFLPSDPRPLLLRVDDLRIDGVPCGADCKPSIAPGAVGSSADR